MITNIRGFFIVLILFMVSPVISTDKCNLTNIEYSHIHNISKCEFLYKKNIMDKIDIEYITLKQLKSRIRLYNYNIYKFNALKNKNRKERRKIRRNFYKECNYKINSNSKELEYLENICSIDYDKMDNTTLEIIKFKNDKIKILIDNQLLNNSIDCIFKTIIIIAFFFMITIMIID